MSKYELINYFNIVISMNERKDEKYHYLIILKYKLWTQNIL